jgi:hypothetical protein
MPITTPNARANIAFLTGSGLTVVQAKFAENRLPYTRVNKNGAFH